MQKTLKFINGDASSIHGNLKVASIYTSESGEWKVGGFEVLSNVKDDDALVYVRFHTWYGHLGEYGKLTSHNRDTVVLCQTRGGTVLLKSQTADGKLSRRAHTMLSTLMISAS